MSEYRRRLYGRYASIVQNTSKEFDRISSSRWGRAAGYYLRGLLPADKDARIVDLGCGGGRLLHFFSEQGYKSVVGIDNSPEQIALSKQVVSDVIQSDVLEYLKSTKERYDLITAFDVIEHLQKDEVLSFLDGCFEALKPNGRLIVHTNNGATPWGTIHHYDDFTHEVCITPRSGTALLSLCGYSDVYVREAGPVPWGYSVTSSVRSFLWWFVRYGLKLCDLIETGESGKVYTRAFILTGRHP